MGKYKKLFKNLGILTIGQFGSKILVFLLVPLYTSVLSTEEYGTYDLIFTTINLLYPIATLNIAVAVQRFLLDNNCLRDDTIFSGLKYTFIGLAIIGGCLAINNYLGLYAVVKDNEFWFITMYFVLSFNALLIEIAIGSDKIKLVSISGVISTIVMIMANILFLVILKWGLAGYFIANIVGTLSQVIYLVIRLGLIKRYDHSEFSKNNEMAMLKYSRPQIANTIAWWINNASDRYVVTWLCGISVNGIYSVGYKIPSILNVVQNIFGQAWGISAVKNFDEKDDDGFFLKTYNLYNSGMIICCSIIILSTKIIAKFMYAKEFYDAWFYVPILSIASVFGAMSGYLGGIFAAKKEAKLFAKSTVIGAITNVILNIILVMMFGAIGAAIATLISYVVIWAFRLIHARKYIELNLPISRDVVSYLFLVLQASLLMAISNQMIMYSFGIIVFLIIILLRINEFKTVYSAIKKK